MVLHDVPSGRIIVVVDAFVESAGNLAPPLLVDILRDLGLQPMEFAFGDLLENLASNDLGGDHHVAKDNN
jgi:hypothetical protein